MRLRRNMGNERGGRERDMAASDWNAVLVRRSLVVSVGSNRWWPVIYRMETFC
jgi:hypothetical protein